MEPPFLSPGGEVACGAQRESWASNEGGGEKVTLIPMKPTQVHLWMRDPVFRVKQSVTTPLALVSPLELMSVQGN